MYTPVKSANLFSRQMVAIRAARRVCNPSKGENPISVPIAKARAVCSGGSSRLSRLLNARLNITCLILLRLLLVPALLVCCLSTRPLASTVRLGNSKHKAQRPPNFRRPWPLIDERAIGARMRSLPSSEIQNHALPPKRRDYNQCQLSLVPERFNRIQPGSFPSRP